MPRHPGKKVQGMQISHNPQITEFLYAGTMICVCPSEFRSRDLVANVLVVRDHTIRSSVKDRVEKQLPRLGKAVGASPLQRKKKQLGHEGSLPTLCMGFGDLINDCGGDSWFFLPFCCHVDIHSSVGKRVFYVIKMYSF